MKKDGFRKVRFAFGCIASLVSIPMFVFGLYIWLYTNQDPSMVFLSSIIVSMIGTNSLELSK